MAYELDIGAALAGAGMGALVASNRPLGALIGGALGLGAFKVYEAVNQVGIPDAQLGQLSTMEAIAASYGAEAAYQISTAVPTVQGGG